MADYYSILKKTVSGLPTNTPENRKVVYGKARQAIDRQLRSLDPAPSEETIARQMQSLEQAIEKMEQEFEAASPPPTAAPAPPAESQEPQLRAPEPAAQPAHGRPVTTPTPPAPPAPDLTVERPAVERPLAGTSALPPDPVVASEPPSAEPMPDARPLAGTRSDPDRSVSLPAYDDSLDAIDDVGGMDARAHHPAEGGRRGSSRLVSVVVVLVVLALIGGGGYALWQNKDPLLAALGLGENVAGQPIASQEAQPEEPDQPVAASEDPEPDEPVAPTDGKEDVRLSQSGETVPGPGQPADNVPAVREAGEPAVPPVVTGDEQPGQVSPVVEPGETPAEDTGEQVAADEPASDEIAADSTLPAIAQKAYLYEEGSTGAGASRDNAAIVWELDEEVPADGLPAEPVIRGKFDVPGRGLTMQVVIKRNVDDALPASHIIELLFETPPDFSGGNIDNVARFVMKSSEQARGEGLIAVPAKIDTGYFLIALNNLNQAIETNSKLLVDSTWIDIPIGYTSGKRALVTLEKGAQGDKVFRDAFADWNAR